MARMVCSGQMRSSSEKRCFFTPRSSTTDSMTRSQPASSPRSDTAVTRDSAPSRSASASLPLSTWRASDFSMAATMPSAVLWARERRTTSKPCTATVSAMPEPMIPEPTIPTRLIDMGRMLPAGYLHGPSDHARPTSRTLNPRRCAGPGA